MTDLDLRRQIAEALGWTKLHVEAGSLWGCAPGDNTYNNKRVPEYELSLDALFRDVVPVMNAQGWYLVLSQDSSGFEAQWLDRYGHVRAEAFGGHNPAIAIATAFLSLVKAAKAE